MKFSRTLTAPHCNHGAIFRDPSLQYVREISINQTGLAADTQYALRVDFSSNDDPATGPSIFTAVREQLGLTLTAGKAPVKRLVIDRVERPDAN